MRTAQDIILAPVITEKSTNDIADGKYTFKVAVDATKTEIKLAVEKLFGVKVTGVNTVNREGKMKRMRYVAGKTAATKKAVVTIATEAVSEEYLVKGGKSEKVARKYKTSIEEFGFGQ